MRAYSPDLRERVLTRIDVGKRLEETAEVFGVHQRTIKRWLQRREETGKVIARRSPGRPRLLHGEHEQRLAVQSDTYQDETLQQHCQRLAAEQAEQQVQVSRSTLSRALLRLKRTRKKDAVRE